MQPPAPAASTDWVSFDDDNSGGVRFTAPGPAFAAAGPASWAVRFDAPDHIALASQEQDFQHSTAHLTPAATTAAGAPSPSTTARLEASAAASAGPLPTSASPPAPQSSLAPPGAPPFFTGLHGGGSVTHPAAANLGGPSTTSTGGSSPPAASGQDPAATNGSCSLHQRLPRPPMSTPCGASGLPAANPFGSEAVPPPLPSSASSNPFASSSNSYGVTAAAVRSLDPFADLSLRPSLPRPPPMVPSKPCSPPSTSTSEMTLPAMTGATPKGAIPDAGAAAGVGLVGSSQAGTAPGPAAGTAAASTVAVAVAGGLGLRRPPTANLRAPTTATAAVQPALGSGPAKALGPAPATSAILAGPSSVFPSFATLHHQQHQPLQRPPSSASASSLSAAAAAAAAASQTLATATGAAVPTAPNAAVGAVAPQQPVASGTSQLSATRAEQGLTQGQAHAGGPLPGTMGTYSVMETTSFDAFTTAPIPSTLPPGASRPGMVALAAAVSPPPPPPYAAAVNMPSPILSLHEVGLLGTPPGLTPPPPPPPTPTPPPPYMEALDMQPDVQLPSSLSPPPPPPPYEEAVFLPAVVSPPLGHVAIPPGVRGDAYMWPVFEESSNSSSSLAGPSGGPSAHRSRGPQASAASGTSSQQSTPAKAVSAPPPDQICVEVRLPPLKPKEAAWPKLLVAGMGLLFAAPAGEGVTALQWWLQSGGRGRGEPCFALPLGAGRGPGPGVTPNRSTEDADSAPASDLRVPELPVANCMLLDEVQGRLWTGHKDGWVARWSVEPGRVAVCEHKWKAHLRGKITSMILDPWGNLWTGASAGTIRAWQCQGGLAAPGATKLFECRRSRASPGSTTRTNAGVRPHSKTRLLCLGPSGRVVWSTGRTGLALWRAYDGEFLGTLTPGLQQQDMSRSGGAVATGPTASALVAAVTGAYAGDTGSQQLQQQQMEINPLTGLDAAQVFKEFKERSGGCCSEEADGDPDLDLGQHVFKGLVGAARLAAKLGKKIRQNLAESTGVGAAAEGGPTSELYPSGPGGWGKVVALIPGPDQSVYVAYRRGVLEKYTEMGRRVWTCEYGRRMELYGATLVGSLLWLGCGDGAIRTASAASGDIRRSWKAHDFPVVGLAHDTDCRGWSSSLVYSLSENGSVRGWPAVPPQEAQLLAWRDGLSPCLRHHTLTVLAATWNVNKTRPARQSLIRWLAPARKAGIVSISLQEVEVGTSSVAWDAAVTLLSKSMLERGNQNAQWWATELREALLSAGGCSWERVALRQMSGVVVVVFCRTELQQHVGEVATAHVACGVMGVGGNKGAVAVSMSVFRRRVMFVCSHFAAHQERVEERNENYNKIVRLLHFENTSKAAQQQQLQPQQPQLQQQLGEVDLKSVLADGVVNPDTATAAGVATFPSEIKDDGHGPGLSDAAMLIWAGDFNYRINHSYAQVVEWSCNEAFQQLFEVDQCHIEMKNGRVFRGLQEPLPLGHPVFVPTYKYDKGVPHRRIQPSGWLELPFDSSEKQRVPAWTDRVLFRGSRPGSLDVAEEEVRVTIRDAADYNCVLDVTDSDHKPVFALLKVHLPGYEQEQKRRHSLVSALAVHQAVLSPTAGVSSAWQPVQVSPTKLHLEPGSTFILDLSNNSSWAFIVQVMTEQRLDATSGARALAPLPSWLEASPTTFALKSQGCLSLRVLTGKFQRPSEPLQLRFVLRPLWGCETLAPGPGPAVSLTIR